MAKKIKFPLEMKDGAKVRTMEELREAFDVEKLLEHHISSKLATWLQDRGYETEAEEVKSIDPMAKDAVNRLCEVFQVEVDQSAVQVDVNEMLQNQEKLQTIRQFTDDKEVLEHIEDVAFTQEELNELITKGRNRIYLLGKQFQIEKDVRDITFCGINQPTISIDTDALIDFDSSNVHFCDCQFDEKYHTLLEKKKQEKENKYKRKKQNYVPSTIFDYQLSDEDRRKSKALFDKVQEQLIDFEFDIDAGSKGLYKIVTEADIFNIFDIDNYGRELKDSIERGQLSRTWDEFLDRIS